MKRVKTLQLRNLVLGLLAVALGVVVLTRSPSIASISKDKLPKLFEKFSKENVSRIELSQEPAKSKLGTPVVSTKRVTLQREQDGSWVVDSAHRYPALKAGVRALLDALAAARNGGLVTSRPDTFAKYAGKEGWRRVRVMEDGGSEVANFAIGREDSYPDVFALIDRDGKQQVIRTKGMPGHLVRLEHSSWIERQIWDASVSSENVIRLDIEQHLDKRTITVARRGEGPADVELDIPEKDDGDPGKVFWITSPEAGDAVTSKVENLARTFSSLMIEDIVAASPSKSDLAAFGLDKPDLTISVRSKNGQRTDVKKLYVGSPIKKDTSDPTTLPEPGSDNESDRYVRVDGKAYVYVVRGKYGVDAFNVDPLDLLVAKKDEEGNGVEGNDAKDDELKRDGESGGK